MENKEKTRERLVVKKNELIQKTRYALNSNEQKILLYVISKIKPDDKELYEYDFGLQEICDVLGITQNGKNYNNLRATLKKLRDKSFWVDDGNSYWLCAWLAGVEVHPNEMRVRIQLDKRLAPYLLDIKEAYTSYQLGNILSLNSKYAIHLYELAKSYSNMGEFTISLDNFREYLQIEGYSDYDNLRRRVIENAIEEINVFSDLQIAFEPVRTGKVISHIHFTITKRPF